MWCPAQGSVEPQMLRKGPGDIACQKCCQSLASVCKRSRGMSFCSPPNQPLNREGHKNPREPARLEQIQRGAKVEAGESTEPFCPRVMPVFPFGPRIAGDRQTSPDMTRVGILARPRDPVGTHRESQVGPCPCVFISTCHPASRARLEAKSRD